MKIEHYVWFEEIIESKPNLISIRVSRIAGYNQEDFNVFLAIALLKQANMFILNGELLGRYEQQKLNIKKILLLSIDYTGKYSNDYLALLDKNEKIVHDSNYKLVMNSQFNSVAFGEKVLDNLPDINNLWDLQLEIAKQLHLLTQKISEEIGQLIDTIDIKYKTPPVTLLIQPFKYDEAEFEKLNVIANSMIKSISVEKIPDTNDEEGIITIMY